MSDDRTRNLTKQHSDDRPRSEYSARGAADDRVHRVLASPVEVVDPASLRTCCGQRVLEVYNDHRECDCEECSAQAQPAG